MCVFLLIFEEILTKMEHKELIKALIARKGELTKELEAIKTLIEVYHSDSNIEGHEVDEQVTTTIKNTIPSKGTMSWENYAVLVLREVGGKAKAAKVANAAIEANPDIDKKTIKSAIRAKLSIKYRDGVLRVTKGKTKKEGYIYILEDTKIIRTK